MWMLSILIACGDGETEVTKSEPVAQQKVMPKKMGVQSQPAAKPQAPVQAASGCDATLKNYSDFVDQYIKLLKKANAGDMTALGEYPKLMEKAEKSGSEIENLYKDGKIDADCWKKYNAITNRMAEAAMDMNGASAEDKADLQELQKAQDKAVDQMACMQECQSKSDPMAQMQCIQGCQ